MLHTLATLEAKICMKISSKEFANSVSQISADFVKCVVLLTDFDEKLPEIRRNRRIFEENIT